MAGLSHDGARIVENRELAVSL